MKMRAPSLMLPGRVSIASEPPSPGTVFSVESRPSPAMFRYMTSRTSNAPRASGCAISPVTVKSRDAVPPVIPWRASWRSTNGMACRRTLLLLRWTTALPRVASVGAPSRVTSTGTSASRWSWASADGIVASSRAVARCRASVAWSRASVGGSPPTDACRSSSARRASGSRRAGGRRYAASRTASPVNRAPAPRKARCSTAISVAGAIADPGRPFEIELLPIRGGGHVEGEAIQGDVGGGRRRACRAPASRRAAEVRRRRPGRSACRRGSPWHRARRCRSSARRARGTTSRALMVSPPDGASSVPCKSKRRLPVLTRVRPTLRPMTSTFPERSGFASRRRFVLCVHPRVRVQSQRPELQRAQPQRGQVACDRKASRSGRLPPRAARGGRARRCRPVRQPRPSTIEVDRHVALDAARLTVAGDGHRRALRPQCDRPRNRPSDHLRRRRRYETPRPRRRTAGRGECRGRSRRARRARGRSLDPRPRAEG